MNVQELLAEVTTAPVMKRTMTNHSTLNEAYNYGSAFSRGMRIDLNGLTILLISGTASIDEDGRTVHVGDFRAQLRRTYENITKLLQSEGATWHDIVRTTCYLRDIERDYQAFNEERTAFFKEQGLDPLPASTGIQAILCRPDLLIEIDLTNDSLNKFPLYAALRVPEVWRYKDAIEIWIWKKATTYGVIPANAFQS